jgi:hypothetical protein
LAAKHVYSLASAFDVQNGPFQGHQSSKESGNCLRHLLMRNRAIAQIAEKSKIK